MPITMNFKTNVMKDMLTYVKMSTMNITYMNVTKTLVIKIIMTMYKTTIPPMEVTPTTLDLNLNQGELIFLSL